MSQREHDLDWLRILVVLMMVPFHTALVFTGPGFMFVKSGTHGPWFWAFVGFTYSWSMPLLFFISGAGAWFSLKKRGPVGFLRERLERLVPPPLLGLLVLVPFSAYLTHLQTASAPVTLWTFLGAHFAHPRVVDLYWGHIWFLVVLLLLAALGLPALLALRTVSVRGLRTRTAAALRTPGVLLLAAIPLAAVAPLPDESGLPAFGWAMLAPQAVAYAAGFLLFSQPALREAIDRNLWPAMAIAVSLALLSIWVPLHTRRDLVPHVVFYLGRWAWVLTALGLGHRFLDHGSALGRYLREAGLPLYLLHVPVASAIAFVVVDRPWPVAAQFTVITAGTFACSFIIYELVVRRFRVLRWLFGLKRGAVRPQIP
ncbi:MAG: acyltransferase family protein [Candidatus Bipolaricaulota bacterium]|nr:MAG: acyltransferase family protein [Candidatus Bipolaricaulota bacterium]